jgi:hypothetical protein
VSGDGEGVINMTEKSILMDPSRFSEILKKELQDYMNYQMGLQRLRDIIQTSSRSIKRYPY